MKLKNKVAIVTAATKGIGLSCAITLAENGAIVYLAARNEEAVKQIIDSHKNLNLKFVLFDAKNEETYNTLVDNVFDTEGRIDILVNNYGGNDPTKDKTIFDTNPNDYLEMFNLNLKPTFVLTHNVVNKMKTTGGGSIVNISTVGSISPDMSRIAYATSKAAINALTQNVAVHAAKYNIRCNAVLPGLTNTDAVKNNLPKEFVDIFIATTPMARAGEPNEVANAVLFFASDDSSYVTGQILSVSGGFGNVTPIYGFFNKK